MPALDSVVLHYVDDYEATQEFMRWLGERHLNDAIAIDIETTGLTPYAHDAAIRLIQVGDTQHGWAMSWEWWQGLFLEAMKRYQGTILTHNQAFEDSWFRRFSVFRFPRERSADTMIAARIDNPLASAALKTITRKIDPRAALGQKELDDGMRENGWDWATVPLDYPPYWQYGALDPVLTCLYWDTVQKDMTTGGQYANVFELEMATRHIASDLEATGMVVDRDYCIEHAEKLSDYATAYGDWAKRVYDVSFWSTQQMAQKIESMGGVIQEYTDKGAPKIDNNLFKFIANPDNGFNKDLRDFVYHAKLAKQARKFASTYFKNYVNLSTYDSRIHPNINTLGARTGRMSVSNPSLQNVPRGDEMVRGAFTSTDPEHGLVSVDFSQIEARLFAHFSHDDNLREAFRVADATGGDFFVEVGKQIYQDQLFDKADKRRNLVKSSMYGLTYGAGPEKIAQTAGVTTAAMTTVLDSLHESYPGIKRFMSETEAQGSRRERETGQGYVITPLGRRQPCDKGKAYTLVNYLIQSTAGDVLKRAFVRLDAAGYTPYMNLLVHDECIFDAPLDIADQLMHDVPEIMAPRKEFSVEIPADAEGPYRRWGDKYKK